MSKCVISAIYWPNYGRVTWSCFTHMRCGRESPSFGMTALEAGAILCEGQRYHESQKKDRPDIASATP